MVNETKAGKLVSGRGDRISESVSKGNTGRAGGAPAPTRHFDPKDVGRQNDRKAMVLDLDQVIADPDQPRKTFSSESLDRLSKSIEKLGQLMPISVRWSPSHSKWMVIAGERRFRAMEKAGITTIRATDKGTTDSGDLLAEQVAENTAREDLAPMDQANAFKTLIEDHGWTQQRLAEELGLSQGTIAQRLALLGADESVQEAVRNEEMSATTGYAASRAPKEAQSEIVKQAIENNLNRSETQDLVDQAIARARPKGAGPKKGKKAPKAIGLEYTRVIRTVSKVKLTAERTKGFDLITLRDAIREAADLIDAEIGKINTQVGAAISG